MLGGEFSDRFKVKKIFFVGQNFFKKIDSSGERFCCFFKSTNLLKKIGDIANANGPDCAGQIAD